MKAIAPVIAVVLFFSEYITDFKNHNHETKKIAEIEKAAWLIGEWGNNTSKGAYIERWTKQSNSVFLGESYFITSGKDTVFSEKVTLDEIDGKLAYTVTVPNQNDAQPVRFEMTSISENHIIFENPKHDFPQKITYNKINNDSLVAMISGKRKGKQAFETFPMKRKK